jgi:hypothetical protein
MCSWGKEWLCLQPQISYKTSIFRKKEKQYALGTVTRECLLRWSTIKKKKPNKIFSTTCAKTNFCAGIIQRRIPWKWHLENLNRTPVKEFDHIGKTPKIFPAPAAFVLITTTLSRLHTIPWKEGLIVWYSGSKLKIHIFGSLKDNNVINLWSVTFKT